MKCMLRVTRDKCHILCAAEWDAKHQKQQAQLETVPHPEAAPQLPQNLQLPAGVKLPPMPAGWKPGMPIPGKLLCPVV